MTTSPNWLTEIESRVSAAQLCVHGDDNPSWLKTVEAYHRDTKELISTIRSLRKALEKCAEDFCFMTPGPFETKYLNRFRTEHMDDARSILSRLEAGPLTKEEG